MTPSFDIATIQSITDDMLSQQSGPITCEEVEWILFVLGHICTNFSPDEREKLIVKTARENGKRPLVGFPLRISN
jgi:hypothetical protein